MTTEPRAVNLTEDELCFAVREDEIGILISALRMKRDSLQRSLAPYRDRDLQIVDALLEKALSL